MITYNQVVWAPVARSSFQGRTRGIPGSISRGNNAWPIRMPLRTSWTSRSPLVDRKLVRKKKKSMITFLFFLSQKYDSIFNRYIEYVLYRLIMDSIQTYNGYILTCLNIN